MNRGSRKERWPGVGAVVALVALLAALVAIGAPPDGPAGARWYKGNTHTHSLWSDGNDFPEMIVDWYHARDYDFLALSDHDVLSRGERWMRVEDVVRRAGGDDAMSKYLDRFGGEWVEQRADANGAEVRLRTLEEFRPHFESPEKFLLVEAEEITDSFERLPVHVNAFNLGEVIPPPGGASVRDTMRNILKAVREQEQRLGRPILAHLNHPNYGWGVTAEDLAHVIEEPFFEVYNGHPGVRHEGDADHPSVERLWDIANTIRLAELNAPPLYGLATDDSHTYHGRGDVTPGRGWILVRASSLTPRALIEAMRRGDFYASSGVTLKDVRYDAESRTLEIEIDAAAGRTYTTQFIGTLEGCTDIGQVFAESRGPTARYTLTGDELYVRAMIISDHPPANPSFEGQREQAWTQPVGWEIHVQP